MKNSVLNSKKIIVNDNYFLPILDILQNHHESLLGKEIEMVGFVYKEPDFEDNQFVIARFAVSCCVADDTVYGMMATIDDQMSDVEEDQWVKVHGSLDTTTYHDWDMPLLHIHQMEEIEQLASPYVYDVYTLLE